VGSTAPDFGLEDLRGQTKVLLAFFPAAFTPG
jgi:peroxiredoxin